MGASLSKVRVFFSDGVNTSQGINFEDVELEGIVKVMDGVLSVWDVDYGYTTMFPLGVIESIEVYPISEESEKKARDIINTFDASKMGIKWDIENKEEK